MASAFQLAVGARIRALREAAGLTQREFADAAALNPAFAGRVEWGLQNLTLNAIGRIAFALGVPVEALFAGIVPEREVLEVKPRSNARPAVGTGAPRPARSQRGEVASAPEAGEIRRKGRRRAYAVAKD